MNLATHSSPPISNPMEVLHRISTPAVEGERSQRNGGSFLKLHIADAPESQEDDPLLAPPAPQVDQLVHYLRKRQKELSQREADLQAEVYQWETRKLAAESAMRRRGSELEQLISQVRCQQAELVKLQQSLIDNQEAIRRVVDHLVDESRDVDLHAELTTLKHLLGQQIESNFHRWERLIGSLSGGSGHKRTTQI